MHVAYDDLIKKFLTEFRIQLMLATNLKNTQKVSGINKIRTTLLKKY